MSCWEEFGLMEWSEELGILGGRESGSMEENGGVLGVSGLVLVVEEWRLGAGISSEVWGWIWKGFGGLKGSGSGEGRVLIFSEGRRRDLLALSRSL